MVMKKTTMFVIGIIVLSFIISGYLYPMMPDQFASHWNAQGQVDGYVHKSVGLYIMPAISLIVLGMLLLGPKIDPLRKNIKKFENYYHGFIILITLFLFYIYILTVLWNLDYWFNMTIMIIPAFVILFYYIGILLDNAKPNWFIGIRTPWTLSNKKVWEKTHKLGAKMFKASAVIALLGMIFDDYGIVLVIVPVLFSSMYTLIYSYIEYRKL